MQCKLINGLKLKLKLIFILFKVCFVFSLVQAEELKDFRPEMPAWLQERPSSSKSEDTNAFHPRRPYKWWNAKQMRDTQRALFGIIYDESLFQSISWFNQWCFVFIAFQQNYSLNAKRS